MRVSGRKESDIIILEVHGRILGDDSLELRRDINGWIAELPEGSKPKIILNFSKVSVMDSAGMGVLVASYATVQRKGGRLVLCGLGRGLQNFIVITRLAMVLDVYENEMEAIKSFQEEQE